MGVLDAIKKIRPKDFDVSQVQDNLANHLQLLVNHVNKGALRMVYPMGTYSSVSGTVPTTNYALQGTTNNISKSTFNTTAYGQTMSYKGSVVVISMFTPSTFSGGTIYLTLYKNSKPTAFIMQSVGLTAYATATVGQYTFDVGDYLQLAVRGSSTNIQLQLFGSIEVERAS